MKNILIAGVIALVLFCIFCSVGVYILAGETWRGFQTTSQTGQQFLTHLQAGDFQAAPQMIAPSARTTYTETELRRRWGLLECAIGKVRSWSVKHFEVHADTGHTAATLKIGVKGDKGDGTVDFVLKPEGEQWLITELRFGW